MAIYRKLLLSAGGGIVSRAQQSKQSGTANILIGLGGTGISCLRTVKRAVYERLQPDNPATEIPEYKHIKFLAVDSDKEGLGKPEELDSIADTEFFPITSNNIEAAIRNEAVMATKPEMSWMCNQDIDVPAVSAGAGGKRQIGRYLIMDRSFQFISDLVSLINDAKAGLGATSVGIHIFAGLSGGTGSGTFLDVCYMVQRALQLVGATGNDKIFGYFFLPDVNLCTITDPATRAYIPRNGYAALKELDYCMQLEKNGGKFTQVYQNGQSIAWDRPPVDLCHLISATTTAGAILPNGYDYAMNVVADYVMEFLAQSNGFTIASHLSNVAAKVATVHKDHGACNQYFVIGASNAQVPFKEINTYLASALFDRFSVLNTNMPTKQDMDAFVNETGLIYNNIYRDLKNAAQGEFNTSGVTHKEIKEVGSPNPITDYYAAEYGRKCGLLETKAKALNDPKVQDSFINRVCSALNTRVCKQEYGPFFASQMLNAAKEVNLLNMIDGLITENNKRWDYLSYNYDQPGGANYYGNYDKARRLVIEKPNKSNVEKYENATWNMETQRLEIRICKIISDLLLNLKMQVAKAGGEYYAVFARVMANLANTFAENKAYLDAPQTALSSNPYVIPLIKMEEIRGTLKTFVEGMDLNGMVSQFMGYMLKHGAAWLTGDESKIARTVTDYFVQIAFQDFANRNIMNYLEEIYDTKSLEILKDHIYNDYMKPLMTKAEPLFWNNATYFNTATAGKMGYISVPDIAEAIKGAANDLITSESNAGLQARQTGLHDRIYIMRSYCGLPMYAYHALLNYESEYWKSMEVGRHYYEGKPQPLEGNPIWNWKDLPSVIPQSLCTKAMPVEVQRDVAEGKNLFTIAVQNGFIKPSGTGSNIMEMYQPNASYLAQLKALCEKGEQLCAVRDAMNGGMVKAEIEKLLAAPQVEPTGFKIVCDAVGVANNVVKQNIVCDYFVSSPMFRQQIKGAVDQLMAAHNTLQKLTELSNIGNVQQDYFDALFTGMFMMAGPRVCYTVNHFGMAETIDLSLPTMPYGGLPLYQAYLSYSKLPAETIAAIKQESDNRKNTAAPQMIAALKAFKAGLNMQYMQFMQQNAKKHPQEYPQIIQFFTDLMTTLQTTAPLYGV